MSTAKRTINVNLDSYEKFQKIHKARPQDRTYAETFEFIIKLIENEFKEEKF